MYRHFKDKEPNELLNNFESEVTEGESQVECKLCQETISDSTFQQHKKSCKLYSKFILRKPMSYQCKLCTEEKSIFESDRISCQRLMFSHVKTKHSSEMHIKNEPAVVGRENLIHMNRSDEIPNCEELFASEIKLETKIKQEMVEVDIDNTNENSMDVVETQFENDTSITNDRTEEIAENYDTIDIEEMKIEALDEEIESHFKGQDQLSNFQQNKIETNVIVKTEVENICEANKDENDSNTSKQSKEDTTEIERWLEVGKPHVDLEQIKEMFKFRKCMYCKLIMKKECFTDHQKLCGPKKMNEIKKSKKIECQTCKESVKPTYYKKHATLCNLYFKFIKKVNKKYQCTFCMYKSPNRSHVINHIRAG